MDIVTRARTPSNSQSQVYPECLPVGQIVPRAVLYPGKPPLQLQPPIFPDRQALLDSCTAQGPARTRICQTQRSTARYCCLRARAMLVGARTFQISSPAAAGQDSHHLTQGSGLRGRNRRRPPKIPRVFSDSYDGRRNTGMTGLISPPMTLKRRCQI